MRHCSPEIGTAELVCVDLNASCYLLLLLQLLLNPEWFSMSFHVVKYFYVMFCSSSLSLILSITLCGSFRVRALQSFCPSLHISVDT